MKFQRLLTAMDPASSWAAVWQHLSESRFPRHAYLSQPVLFIVLFIEIQILHHYLLLQLSKATSHLRAGETRLKSANASRAQLTHVLCFALTDKKAAGAYALSIQGEPPQYVEDLMEDNGISLQRQR